jgi:mono/diheme cytochrome c family protein
LNRGKERYDIFCKPCHGELGAGNGITKSFGVATVVTLLDDRLKGQPDGQIFYTITHGKGTMGAYGSNIAVPDRWAIVAYVRALQTVGKRNLETIPSGVRSEIEKLLAQP